MVYVCRKGLSKKHRTKRVADVSAAAVHKWVMRKPRSRLGAESGEGLKRLKAIKVDLGGDGGVRSVQSMFIEATKIREQFGLEISENEIIKGLVHEIKPPSAGKVVRDMLKKDTREARRARKRLEHFHDLLMEMAVTFKEAGELGMGAPKPAGNDQNNPRGGGKGKGRGNNDPKGPEPGQNLKGKGNQRGGKVNPKGGSGNDERKVPKGDGRCVYCGERHFVKDCPKVPPEKRKWTWKQHLKAKEQSGDGDRSSGPRGTAKAGEDAPGKPTPRGEKKSKGTAEATSNTSNDPAGGKKKLLASTNQNEQEALCADGTAKVGPIDGFYTCDGGCDRATVGHHFAKKIEESGVKMEFFKEPRLATLANGAKVPAIIGQFVSDIELLTSAGIVELPGTTVDILKGPEQGNLLYIGREEESRLCLKSYRDQLAEVALRTASLERNEPVAVSNPNAKTGSPQKRKPEISAKPARKPAAKPDAGGGVKRRLGKTCDPAPLKAVESDGFAFASEGSWKALDGI